MLNMLNNLSVKSRFYIAITLFLITLLVSISQSYITIGANIEFAEKEKMGNLYQRPVALMLFETAMIRSYLTLPDVAGSSSKINDFVSSISKNMMALKDAQDKVGEELQFNDEGLESRKRTHLKFETVSVKWDGLKNDLSNAPSEPKTLETLVSFIGDLRGLIAHSGDTSNLILDPDLDSYYLMDVTLLAMPQTIDRMGSIAAQFNSVVAGGSSQDKSVMIDAAVMSRMLAESDVARVVADMDVSFTEDGNFYGLSPTYKESIMPLYEGYQAASAKVSELLMSVSDSKAVPPADFSQAIAAGLENSSKFLASGYDNLDILLDMRIASYQHQQVMMLLISFAGFSLSMVFYIFVAYSISKPLENIGQIMIRLSNSDYSAEVPYAQARSEIGKMSASVQVFKENGMEAQRLKSEQERIEKQALQEKREMLEHLAVQFEDQIGGSIQSLSGAVDQLQDTSKSMEETSRRTREAGASVAAASEETAANVSTVAAATEEMTASAQEIATQVSNVAAKASEASQSAQLTSTQFNQLNDLVANIGEVVTAIKDIADQTNLLALNATIEAARAGDAGKGFAVVADEVKKLATETGKKTEEIEKRISLIQNATQGSVDAMSAIIKNISDIDSLSSSAAAAIEEQNATISEISRNIYEVSGAARDVTNTIHQVQDGANNTGESIVVLRGAADNIMNMSENLDKVVTSFLSQIRSSTD